jgi:hypothetical protein
MAATKAPTRFPHSESGKVSIMNRVEDRMFFKGLYGLPFLMKSSIPHSTNEWLSSERMKRGNMMGCGSLSSRSVKPSGRREEEYKYQTLTPNNG